MKMKSNSHIKNFKTIWTFIKFSTKCFYLHALANWSGKIIELYNCNGGTCIVLFTWDGSNTMHVSPLQPKTKVLNKGYNDYCAPKNNISSQSNSTNNA
jgi:hypothetical protein